MLNASNGTVSKQAGPLTNLTCEAWTPQRVSARSTLLTVINRWCLGVEEQQSSSFSYLTGVAR